MAVEKKSLTRGKKIDMPLVIIVLILLGLGLVMVLSASAPYSLAETGDNSYAYFKRQLLYAVIGIFAMLGFSKVNYKLYKNLYIIIYLASVLILLIVKIPGVGAGAYGAKRWASIGGISFQPSELTKIGLILSLAGYLTNDKLDKNSFFKGTVVPLVAILIPIAILYKVQNHMSAGIIIFFVGIVMMYLSGIPRKNLIIVALLFALGGAGFYVNKKKTGNTSFRSERIDAWLNPEENATGKSYQTMQGLYAIGSGGLFGRGFGESKQKYLYIPAAYNDFIFAIYAEELGFVGCMFVIIMFMAFGARGVYISTHTNDQFGSLVVVGITSLILFQTILNIGVVTNTIPNTGISLPFLSYGGTSLVIIMICVGIILNVSRYNETNN